MPRKELPSLVAKLSGEFSGRLRKRCTHALAAALSFCVVAQASGKANFTSKDYAVGQLPILIVVHDFNGDGKPDLAVLNAGPYPANGTISILLGNGDGTFQAAKTFDAGGPTPATISAADFNGDGKLDLAIATPSQTGLCAGGSVYILLGNGDGTFQPATKAFDLPSIDVLATVGDVNADGLADIVVAREQIDSSCSPEGGYSVFLGNGDGTFQAQMDINLSPLDFNGDGIPDLVSSFGLAGPLTIFLGQGNGRYLALASGPEGNTGYITLGDFNNDSKQDQADWVFIPCKGIFCEGGTTYVGIVLGNGDGTFQSPQLFPPGGYPWFPGEAPSILALSPGDFNGDGKLDVAYINGGASGFRVLLGKGDGTLPSLVNFDTGSGPGYFVVADLNGDGRPDAVLANLNDGTISVALNTFPTAGADLAVTLGANPSPVSVTQILTYQATLQNQGPEDASNVVLTETLPSGMSFVSAGISAGTCAQANLVVTCNIAKFVSADSALLTVTVIPTATGTANNSVSVAGDQTDGNTANNTAMVSTQVDPMFTLTIVKAGNGTGNVSGAGLDCGANCAVNLPTGTMPSLSATPDANMGFGGWSGICGVNLAPTCAGFAMNANQTVTVEFDTLPNFAFWLTFSSIVVQQGQTDTEAVALYPEGPSFANPVALTCTVQGTGTPLPTCAFSPSSVTLPDSNGGTSNLTVTTTAPTLTRATPFGQSPLFYAFSLPVFGTLIAVRFRYRRLTGNNIVAALVSALFLTALMVQSACGSSSGGGGGSQLIGGTPKGTYTITITGTSGALQHSTAVTLTVD